MKSGLLLFFSLLFCIDSMQSQEEFMYRLYLKDKGNPPFTLSNPEAFLSSESIERRKKQGLAVDSFDLPLDPVYLEAIAQTGVSIRAYSKWTKTVVVHLSNPEILPKLEQLPFVDSLYCVWKGNLPVRSEPAEDDSIYPNVRQNQMNSYGVGFVQMSLNNGHRLHDAGFRGKGIAIAVIDGGFINVDRIAYFNQDRIKKIKNFNHEVNDILRESNSHGTRVLSCLLSDMPGEMTGTAPDADYYLLRTEITDDEFPVEEDYWTAALEYADSLGVSIVSSSLGYAFFDDSGMNHTHAQLDGRSVPISRAADLAASRGMLLFVSAGNEGSRDWRKINFPGDAEHIITVGSVTRDSTRSVFSSVGFTADGRIKPDLMAMGSQVSIVDGNGVLTRANGTSFSAPILAGLAACLWEALPERNSFEMLRLLRETANRFQHPDSLMGYGIADVYKACTTQLTGIRQAQTSDLTYFSINPSDGRLYINLVEPIPYDRCILNIYSAWGNRLLTVSNLSGFIDISSLPKGMYIACLQMGNERHVRKFIKR